MAEELVLTDPIVITEKVVNKYRVSSLNMCIDEAQIPGMPPGYIIINLKNNYDVPSQYVYSGDEAIDFIKWMNTANFTVNSMQKRVLQKLSNDGHLPGTVTGTPEPPALADPEA